MIAGQFWPTIGGSENQCRRLAAELARQGLEVEVWTRRLEKDWPRRETVDGVLVRRFGPAGPLAGLRVRRLERYAFALVLFLRLLREGAAFDVLHVQQLLYPALVLCLARPFVKRPAVGRVACSGTYSDYLWLRRPLGLPLRLVRRQLDRVVAIDPGGRDESLAAGFPRNRVLEITNGVDVPDARAPRDAGPLRVVSVSMLRRQKRIELLLRAWSRLGEPGELRIVGDGAERRRLEDEARGLGLRRTVFAGEIPEPRRELQQAHVFVLASDAEGMSNALLEAMAAGCACVATAVGGNGQALGFVGPSIARGTFVRGEAGLLIAPDDVEGLAAALQALLESPALREQLGSAAHRRCLETFALSAAARAYAALYRSLQAR